MGVYNLDIKTAGMIGAAYSIPASVFRAYGGHLSDKFGARRVMYWTYFVSVVATFILSYPPTQYTVQGIRGPMTFSMSMSIVGFMVVASVLGFFMSLGKAAVYKHIPVYYPDRVGAVGGVVGLVGGLGGFVLPIAFGTLSDLTGVWQSCFWLLFVVAAVSLVWMHFAVRQMERDAAVAGVAAKWLPELPDDRRRARDAPARASRPGADGAPAGVDPAAAPRPARGLQARRVRRGRRRRPGAPGGVRRALRGAAGGRAHLGLLLRACVGRLPARAPRARHARAGRRRADAAHRRTRRRPRRRARRLAVGRARRRSVALGVPRAHVRGAARRRLRPAEGCVGPRRAAEPRRHRAPRAHGRRPAREPRTPRRCHGDEARLRPPGLVHLRDRAVQRHRAVPQDRLGLDVPLLHGHPRRAQHHPRPRQRPAVGAGRLAPCLRAHRRGAVEVMDLSSAARRA